MPKPDPIVIEDGRRRGLTSILAERRLVIAGVIALAEVGYVVFGNPGAFVGSLVATVFLILAVMLALRTARGPLRDLLWVLALAQVFVIAILSLKIIVSTIVIVVAVIAIVGGILYFVARSRLRKFGVGR